MTRWFFRAAVARLHPHLPLHHAVRHIRAMRADYRMLRRFAQNVWGRGRAD